MNRALVTVAYLIVVFLGSVAVHNIVENHRFNVAEQQLKNECQIDNGNRWVYICNGVPTIVVDRMRELVQDDGSL